ncbi:hypothetical protein AC579_3085 [Pseudocercospora musae]|uniref:Major facilitator superfamily (MFS) profile domain-containing protein n=1 Tax=Pseudocercospora musae TaxID=113226 RepID=A0A139GSY0_9PEZI|nr:hypothetical protein AC579_3085 [Pseudocercospora musae]
MAFGVQSPSSHKTEESNLSSQASLSPVDDEKKDVEKGTEQPNGKAKDIESGLDQPSGDSSPLPPARGPNLVEFDGPNDPGNPLNFSTKRKTAATVSMGLMTFVVTFSSSIFAVAIEPISDECNVSTVVATLGVSLFLLGFVFGVCFGPASEIWGRRTPLFADYICFAIFQIPVVAAQNVETIMIADPIIGGFVTESYLGWRWTHWIVSPRCGR